MAALAAVPDVPGTFDVFALQLVVQLCAIVAKPNLAIVGSACLGHAEFLALHSHVFEACGGTVLQRT